MVYLCLMQHLRCRRSRGPATGGPVARRRAGLKALALLAVTAVLVLLAVVFHLGVAAAVVGIAGIVATVPGGYLAWAALPAAGREQGAPDPAGTALEPAGWPLAQVRDPFALEVHHPVEPDVPTPGLAVLPEYYPREHDAALAEVVTAAAAGTSGIAVMVGGSSTGKTRASWEALELLRGLEPGWLAGAPDPTRREH